MPAIKITSNGAVTLPAKIRKALGLKVGDFVNAELKKGRVVLKPAKIIDAEDAFFYTKEWQKGESEADRDIKDGKLAGPFSSVGDFINDLEK
ncbi:MAG: AbrB/MazE/SpoVT family DNA-binding domain-containing protein [Dissulfuribacterales bacterium]